MVRGLDTFLIHFKGYESSYVLIGGAACSYCMEKSSLTFRSTKDLDIILIIEAVNRRFASVFWDFIKKGGYQFRQKSSGKRTFYRFFSPEDESFPFMLELFSKKPPHLPESRTQRLTPLMDDGKNLSLSAILMNEDYYNLIMASRKVENGLSYIPPVSLILLKACAYLDLKQRADRGEHVDSKDIKKHKNDTIRLSFLLSDSDGMELGRAVRADLNAFISELQKEPPDMKAISKEMGIQNVPALDEIIENFRHIYGIDQVAS
jgi:hypothetical protein